MPIALFQCLTVSIRPLRVEELAEVLAVQFDAGRDSEYSTEWRPGNAQQAVLSACSSLITIVNVDGSPVVQFAHFSVEEFLTSDRLRFLRERKSLSLSCPLLSAHIVLAQASLSVLLSLDAHVDKSAVEKRPLSLYAAQHWVDHAKIEGVSSSIQDLMKRLFDPDRPYFATWVWIYDVDRPWKGSMAMVHPTQPEAAIILCGTLWFPQPSGTPHPYIPDGCQRKGRGPRDAVECRVHQGEVEMLWHCFRMAQM
jgi:hypothetical protein